jgi:hypothetical protein
MHVLNQQSHLGAPRHSAQQLGHGSEQPLALPLLRCARRLRLAISQSRQQTRRLGPHIGRRRLKRGIKGRTALDPAQLAQRIRHR